MEGFEMKDVHRQLLVRSRKYLLHNIRPTETFWSSLLVKEIFSEDMIDDIKSSKLKSEQIGKMLDLLPARGPSTFEQFCEVLLECDHSHVAEYLKTAEATDTFRSEISRQCAVSDIMIDQFVNIYKHNTPVIKRFAEQKFELLLEEQGKDLEERESELRDLTATNSQLELANSQLQSFVNTFHGLTEDINREVQNDMLSGSFLRETHKYLGTLKEQLKDLENIDMICQVYSNMQALLQFLEQQQQQNKANAAETTNKTSNVSTRSGRPYSALRRIGSAFDDEDDNRNTGTMKDKMHISLRNLNSVIQTIGTDRTYVTAALIRPDLETVAAKFQEIIDDVFYIKDVFKTTLRQKRKLEGELMSFVHNWQETRRLEREVKEKQGHITELNKENQVLKKKTRGQSHKKQLEQIQRNLEQKRQQLRELQRTLERHLGSADIRLHSLIGLLPDLDDNDVGGRSDTEMFSEGFLSRATTRVMTANKPELDNAGKNSGSSSGDENNNKPEKKPQTETKSGDTASSKPAPSNTEPKFTSRLLERRYNQQQRASQLAMPRARVQRSKGPTMKYTPQPATNQQQPQGKLTKSLNHQESLTSRIQSILDRNKNNPTTPKTQPPTTTTTTTTPKEEPVVEVKEIKEDPIEKWLAKEKEQRTKAVDLQKKVHEFNVVEGEDRTDEIRQLGRTLQSRPASASDAAPERDKDPVVKDPDKKPSNPFQVQQLANRKPPPLLSPKSHPPTSSQNTSSREGSGDSSGATSRVNDSRTVSVSMMAGDLLSCSPAAVGKKTPHVRHSLSDYYAARNTTTAQSRTLMSTTKVNLFIPKGS